MNLSAASRLEQLSGLRGEFIGFLTQQLHGNRADAEDVLQHGWIKALHAAPSLRDDDRLIPWFYQVLRHSLVDHVRARQTTTARDARWADEIQPTASLPADTEKQLCQCLASIAASLPPRPRALIQRVDLGGEPVFQVATALGITPNAASVALHRARAQLREKLEAFCGECAASACLDCDCNQ